MKSKSTSGSPDYAYCSQPDDSSLFGQNVNLLQVAKTTQMQSSKAHGRWIGMIRCQGQGREWVEEALLQLQKQPEFNKMSLADLCNYLIMKGKPIKVIYIRGHWLDVNSLDDLDLAFQLQG